MEVKVGRDLNNILRKLLDCNSSRPVTQQTPKCNIYLLNTNCSVLQVEMTPSKHQRDSSETLRLSLLRLQQVVAQVGAGARNGLCT